MPADRDVFEVVFASTDNCCLAWPCLICDHPYKSGDRSFPNSKHHWAEIPLMKQGVKSQPSLRLLGSFGNSSLINRSMVDRHAEARAFLVKLAQEFAKGMNLQLENATLLQAKLLLQLAVVGKKPLKLCEVAGQMPWINKYMMKHGQFTSEAIGSFFVSDQATVPHKHGFADGATTGKTKNEQWHSKSSPRTVCKDCCISK